MTAADKREELDPKGLIRESFRIDGIQASECRSIFLDWALSRPEHLSEEAAINGLLERHATEPEDHPMKQLLRAARPAITTPRRRGGWRARRGGADADSNEKGES